MTREEAKKILEDGGYVYHHVWTFWKTGKECDGEPGCCYDSYNDVEETLDNIEFFCDGNWEKVTS